MGIVTTARTQLVDDVDLEASPYAPPRHVTRLEDCYFYHTMELPEFGVQEGGWDLRGRFKDYIGGVDLIGKRVLDVGAASGFLTFEAERHGAREVVSFDLDGAHRQTLLPFAGSPYVTNHDEWCRMQTANFMKWQAGYWLAHRLFGSKARALRGDVYRPPAGIGRFDVVILGAILEHLIDPLSALRAMAELSDDLVVINTDYFDHPERLALFLGRAGAPHHSFTFWMYSIAIYDEYMKIMGFRPVAARKDTFPGTRPSPDADRPQMPRVALVYARER